jgi:hypothetical protein
VSTFASGGGLDPAGSYRQNIDADVENARSSSNVITRVSLVKLRSGLTREQVLELWLGPHADVVRAMPEVQRYVVALAEGDRADDQWDAVATLQFANAAELERALGDPGTRDELVRTREPFLTQVDAFVVEEHVVIDRSGAGP